MASHFQQSKMFPRLTCGRFFHYARGMTEKPITDLINEWKPRKSLADEIGASVEQVHKWAKFGRIPAEWHYPVILAARAKGLAWCDAEWMARAHHEERGAA
jgi:hypothetical protein